MNFIRNCLLVFLATTWAFFGSAHAAGQKIQVSRPEIMVGRLYREVQLHAPSGLLSGANSRRFAPYLSRSLRRKMDLAAACEKDWFRQNPDQNEKAPFGWSEFGLFSGANERISPGNFHIEHIRKDTDGSFDVVVIFTYRPSEGTGPWGVTDRVIREDGRFVVDDVIFPKERQEDGYTLSGRLSEGCSGPRWVGEGGHQH